MQLALGVTGPQQRDRTTTEYGGRHEGVERADLGPVEGHQQWLFALLGEPADEAVHGVADVDPVVVAEPPRALDAALGGGVARQTSADGRKGGASNVCGRFD